MIKIHGIAAEGVKLMNTREMTLKRRGREIRRPSTDSLFTVTKLITS